MTKERFKSRFAVGGEDLDRVVGAALSRGGDYADLYFEDSVKNVFRLTDSKVTFGGLFTDFGVGVRTLSAEKTGYAYCAGTQVGKMEETARAAALIASREVKYKYTPRDCTPPAAYPQEDDWSR